MKRIDYIRAMKVRELAKAIIENNVTDDFCKSDCGNEEDCPQGIECCVKWLNEDDNDFANKVWSDDND